MAKDKNVNIKITANTESAQKGIKGITSELNKFSNKMKNNSMLNIGAMLNPTLNVISKLKNGIATAAKAINDLSQTAQKQIKAEKQLETAAKNNPYLNKSNVSRLKEYASELQRIGTIGDEELLPFMAQLAAAGRTQAEIQDIMSAALDVSASGAMSMESAVKNLNKTYSGLSGELGESIPQIKSLTKEQLKNGDAVKVIAEQYKGMAKASAESEGAGKQLSNALGDLKEQLGMGLSKIIPAVQRGITRLAEAATNAIQKFNILFNLSPETADIKESDRLLAMANSIEQSINRLKSEIEEESEELKNNDKAVEESRRILEKYDAEQKKSSETAEELKKKHESLIEQRQELSRQKKKTSNDDETQAIEKEIDLINQQINEIKALRKVRAEENAGKKKNVVEDLSVVEARKNIEDYEAAVARLTVKEEELASAEQRLSDTTEAYTNALESESRGEAASSRDEYMTNYRKKLEEEIRQTKLAIEARRATGESVSALDERYEILQARLSAFNSLVLESDGLVSMQDKDIQAIAESIKEEASSIADANGALETFKKYSAGSGDNEAVEQLKNDLSELKALAQDESLMITLGIDSSALEQGIKNCEEQLKALAQNVPSAFQNACDAAGQIMDSLSEGLSNVSSYFSQYTDASLQELESESESEGDSLKTQYEEGLISYEEYLAGKEALDKETAKKEYKIKEAQWQMDLAMASVNAAQATLKALASSSPPLNIVNAATAGLLGAAQIAVVAANKPKMPSFSTGGFLTGSSTSGDKIPFKGNAGEAVLNPAEMRNFMALANGEASGQGISVTMPVNIINNSAGDTAVSVERQERTLQVTIDKMVNAGFKSGTYTDSMGYAETQKTGARYL